MRRLTPIVLLLSLGCGSNPADDRLPRSAEVMIYSDVTPNVAPEEMTGEGHQYVLVPVGTTAIVVADEWQGKDRKVRVKITEGKFTGESCLVRRQCLRPR